MIGTASDMVSEIATLVRNRDGCAARPSMRLPILSLARFGPPSRSQTARAGAASNRRLLGRHATPEDESTLAPRIAVSRLFELVTARALILRGSRLVDRMNSRWFAVYVRAAAITPRR